MKWIEHTLSLYPGSQAVLFFFSVFKAFIQNFLFSPFFKTLGKQYLANGFLQSLQFPLVKDDDACHKFPKSMYLISMYHLYNQ